MRIIKTAVLITFLALSLFTFGSKGDRAAAQNKLARTDLKNDEAALSLVRPYRTWEELRKPGLNPSLAIEIVNSMAMG